jgi:phage terminase large subunit GpA-like protein
MTKRKQPGFANWVEKTIHLPVGTSAEPGRITLPIYLREIADAFTKVGVEKITIQKSARIGYSTLLNALIAWHMSEDPCAILAVLPAEADARNAALSLEETFAASPDLQGKLPDPSMGRATRNTILVRRSGTVPGASLRLVGANAPRNLRAISAKLVVIDEADALMDSEGDVVELASARTLTWKDRRIILGGTPLEAATSRVTRSYGESDCRVYECRCPSCNEYAELQWPQFQWDPGAPDTVQWVCPACGVCHPEAAKKRMVKNGRWRALRPEAGPKHRGYRLSALISSLPHATWSKLAKEWESAAGDVERTKTFYNLLLGLPYEPEGDSIDGNALQARAENFSLDAIPGSVCLLVGGVDCADDRLEIVVCGFDKPATTIFVLHHEVIHGSINDALTWQQLHSFLKITWPHPRGGIRIRACCVDAGDGGHMKNVLDFCTPRAASMIMAIKGLPGFSRIPLDHSKSLQRGGGRLWLVASDVMKNKFFERSARGNSVRFSKTLSEEFFEQLGSERKVAKRVNGRPVIRFERVKGMRAEALDALCYAWAARYRFKSEATLVGEPITEASNPAAVAQNMPPDIMPEPPSPAAAPARNQVDAGQQWVDIPPGSWWDRRRY